MKNATIFTSRKVLASDSDCDGNHTEGKPVKKHAMKSKKSAKKQPFRLSDLESDSSEDLESLDSPEGVTKLPERLPAGTVDRNDVIRQALLASSDSEVESDMDATENVNKGSETVKPEKDISDDNSDVVQEVKLEADENTNGDQIKTDAPVKEEESNPTSAKTSKLKSHKLLRASLADSEAEEEVDEKKIKGKETKGGKKKSMEKRKRRIHSDSDFESSDSAKGKKSKRKRKNSSAEDIADSDDTEEESKVKTRPRRRIKKTVSSGDDSGDSDIQVLNESVRSEGGAKGRKNIKKIMKDTNLKVTNC